MDNLKFYVVSLLALVLSFAAVPALADDDETTYSYSELETLLASFEDYTFDDSALGCYSVSGYTAETINSALTTANALTESSDESTITESYNTLNAILTVGFTLNLPQAGTFLRIESGAASGYYMSSENASAGSYVAFTDATDASTILYYDGSSLRSYDTGEYPTCSYSFSSSSAPAPYYDGVQDPFGVTFSAVTVSNVTKVGYYAIHYHENGTTSLSTSTAASLSVTAANKYATGNTYRTNVGGLFGTFKLSEIAVADLPITQNSAGYATIYSPVEISVPDGATPYVVSIDSNGDPQWTELSITTIPANSGVVLKYSSDTESAAAAASDDDSDDEEITYMNGQVAAATATGSEYVLSVDDDGNVTFTQATAGDELAGFTAYATAETTTTDVDDAETTTFTINTTTGVLRRWNNDYTSENSSAGTYFAYWTSNDYLESDTDPYLILYVTSTANNMTYDSDGNINAAAGSSGCDYTLLTASGYVITGYSFDYTLAGSSATTFTIGDDSYTPSSTTQSVSITDLSDQTVTAWTQSGNNLMALSNFTVTVAKTDYYKTHVNLFQTPVYRTVGTYWIPYRIPAIATAKNGDVIAVADYRYSGKDIGVYGNSSGRLDLHYSVSSDNGATWTDPTTIPGAVGYSNSSSDYNGFGDPAIVADRESNKILLLCCTGSVSYSNGTRDSHQGIARFYAEYDETEGEWVWSPDADDDTDDISETIYSMFDESTVGTPASMFVGSGRIFQSSTCKVGDYYRIYCAVLYKDVNSVEKNYVLYSDDFGQTWSVLGGVDAPGVTSGANEPKVEELPDGSIVLSSRITGGRYYNIYTFTSTETGAGYWGTQATSNSSNSGVAAVSNSCNGELMILPVVDSDGNSTYLALQSVPFGSGRANVGIYYKELASLADDYADPSTLAGNWDGSYQMSYIGSAYSTMTLQADGNLGFLFEEEAYGSAAQYTIVYYNLSISEITGGQYSYDASAEKAEVFTSTLLYDEYSNYSSLSDGSYVGMISNISDITTAYNAYTSDPSQTTYEAFHAAIVAAETIEIEEDKLYTLLNYYCSGYYMEYDMINKNLHARSDWDYNQMPELFRFVAADTEGEYYVQNVGTGLYIGQTSSGSVPTTDDKEYTYTVTSTTDGLSLVACTDPTNSARPYLHLQTSGYLVVCWGSTDASYWYIKPVEIDAEELLAVAETSLDTQRKQNSDEYSTLSTALTTYKSEETDDNLLALYTAVYTYQNAAAPQAGNFYRFQGGSSSNYITNGTTSSRVSMGSISTTDITDANYISSIYYLDDANSLINYEDGYAIFNSERGLYSSSTPSWTISYSATTYGKFNLYNSTNSRWLYDSSSYINRNSSLATTYTEWAIEEVDYLPVTISSVGKATLYTPVALEIPDGVAAYTLTFDLTAGTAKKTQLSDVIPAETGVLLEHDETAATTYKFYISDETSDADGGELTGSVYTQEISDISNYNYYILYNGTNGVAFYAVNSLTSPYLSGSKAYYFETVSTSSESPAYFGIDGTTTGVTTLLTEADDTDEPYYDLQGRPTKNPAKGIYIKDGRKVYVK